jgi:hypothetical protein
MFLVQKHIITIVKVGLKYLCNKTFKGLEMLGPTQITEVNYVNSY